MASFLRQCIRCGAQVRFMSVAEVPTEVRCESCVSELLVESLREPTATEAAEIKRTRPKRPQMSEADLRPKKN